MRFERTIGLIGGLGPFAGAYALTRLLEKAATLYGCKQDEEFPEVILCSVPFKGTSPAGLQRDNSVKADLIESLRGLECCGVKTATILCNSSHVYLPELARTNRIGLISLIDAPFHRLSKSDRTEFCVLCSRSARESGLFNELARRTGKRLVRLSDKAERLTDKLIHRGMLATLSSKHVRELQTLIEEVSSRGTRAVIIGCTELSRLNAGASKDPHTIDTLDEALTLLLESAV